MHTTASSATGSRLSGRLRIAAARHPEWWVLAITVSSWQFTILTAASNHDHASSGSWSWVLGWMVMVSAMMLPLSIPTIRLAAARSLWIRRHRAILVFLLAFFLVWLVFGAAAVFVQYTMARLTGVNRWGTAAFLVAAVWEFAPAKPRAITACERSIPLAPRGWRADRDCVRYGGRIAAYCIVSCWPRMLAMIAAPSVSTMAVVTLMGVADRRTSQPKVWWNALILVALGARALAAPG